MARVRITRTRKTKGARRIVGLYGPSIGYQSAEEVAVAIRNGCAHYFVRAGSWEAEVRVVEAEVGMRLISTEDVLSRNNLLNLPDC